MVQPNIPIKWKVELEKEIDATLLEGEVANQMSMLIQEEIDWELITDMMIAVGWTKITLDRFKDRYQSIDIQLWLDEHCRGHYKNRGGTFMFEKAEEAEWFSLRWL